MSGAAPEHEEIVSNAITALKIKLRGRKCKVYASNLKVKIPSYQPYCYPDVTALCGEPQYEKMGGMNVLVNPVLIVEVLSSITEAFDRGDKFSYYKSIESFSEYLLVAQHRPHITHYVKQADGSWKYEEVNGLENAVNIETLNCVLTLEEIYDGITFLSQPVPISTLSEGEN